MAAARPMNLSDSHFITEGLPDDIQLGTGMSFVFQASDATEVLSVSGLGHVQLSANSFAKGRGVYLSELPYNLDNARLLLRAIAWAAGKESVLDTWVCDNPNTDCAHYVEAGCTAVANHTDEPQTTSFVDGDGTKQSLTLKPYEMTWV